MADIFREVDEEVRRDRALEFWKRYQTLFIILAVVIVAAAGGYRYYQERQRSEAEAAGARYEGALQLTRENKISEADEAFQSIIKQGPAGYALLARFRSAADAVDTDKTKAVAIYDALASDAKLGAPLQDVARIRAALLRLDEADQKEIETRLNPLAQAGAPFRNTARELLAVAALKREDYAAAGRYLDSIVVDAQAPQGVRQRAEALLGLVSGAKSASPTPPPK
jgi:hypothetical protein